MQLRKYILGELLFLANSKPPYLWRSEFYRIKDRLLTLYATWDGVHLQHISKPCFRCEGSGKNRVETWVLGELANLPSGDCPKCGGTGIYSEFWTVLASYKLGRRLFHLPRQRYFSREAVPAIMFDREIEGLIEHDMPKYYLWAESAYWLALIVDPKLFLDRIGRVGYPSRKFTPLVIVGNFIYRLREIDHWLHRRVFHIQDWIVNFRQAHCKHNFSDDGFYSRCSKCGLYIDEDVPF